MKIAVLQSNYIPWKGYFDLINSVDEFILYVEVQYTKNDWRNRNKIKTPTGVHWITIPVFQTSLEQTIHETKVSDVKWARKNWNTLVANYSKAPNFNQYKGVFEELYLNCNSEYLSDINFSFINCINTILNIKTELLWSRDLELHGDKNERLIQVCKKRNATHYLSGPAAKDYLDVKLFEENGIAVEWMNYSGYKEYEQLLPPFEHGVSILDLIFNTGDDASIYMNSF